MSGQFVARRGLIALGDTTITGSLNISQNIITAGTIQGTFDGSTSTAISGAFDSVSSSLASDISLNASSINSLNAASSSYLLNTTDTLDGDLTVTGKITAQEFHTEFVSASIIFQSGSTKFGDSSDDVHSFTGSLNVSGSITGTLVTAAQPNITSLGTLSSLGISGNLSVDTNVLFVDAANNRVGVGTSSPAEKLNINGNIRVSTGGIIYTENPAGGRYGSFYTNADGTILQSFGEFGEPLTLSAPSSTGRIAFATAGNERMRITSAGNVGIGISSPTNPLVVNAGGGIIEHRNNADLAELHIRPSATKSGYITFTESGVADRWALGISNGDGSLHFRVPYPSSTPKVSFLSGGGITFNGDTAAANALDDYEEGTWSPVYQPASGTFATTNMQVFSAKYTKVGNQVTITADFRTTNIDTTGASSSVELDIGGLPFTASASSAISVGYLDDWTTPPDSGRIRSNIIELKRANVAQVSRVSHLRTGAGSFNDITIMAVYYTT